MYLTCRQAGSCDHLIGQIYPAHAQRCCREVGVDKYPGGVRVCDGMATQNAILRAGPDKIGNDIPDAFGLRLQWSTGRIGTVRGTPCRRISRVVYGKVPVKIHHLAIAAMIVSPISTTPVDTVFLIIDGRTVDTGDYYRVISKCRSGCPGLGQLIHHRGCHLVAG